jgi:predicted dehydrogenase
MTPRAAIVGTGFMGATHAEALARIGVEVVGVVGSSPATSTYASFDAMLADPRVDVVHLTTPNDLHHPQALAVLAAGKHCICEKPLALTARESRELLDAARASGLVHCTNFNLRFYPLVAHARALVAAGGLGRPYHAQGGYLQDWLLYPSDGNWRVDGARGGALRAFGDIGTHWIDMVTHVTGTRVEAVFAELSTFLPERRGLPVATEDVVQVLLRLSDGVRASMTASQISAGRKNHLEFEVDCADGAVSWCSERCDELWVGHRDRPNEVLLKDRTLMDASAGALSAYPPGHTEGYPDTFKQLYRAVYAAVAAGPMPAEDAAAFPTFADGHRLNVVGEAVLRSAREERWVPVSEIEDAP